MPLPGIYLGEKNEKAFVHTKTYTQRFTPTLFAIYRKWEQLSCPERKMEHHAVKYHPVIARNELSITVAVAKLR